MTLTSLSQVVLDDLIKAGLASPRLRQHRNIHVSHDDPCQRFFNAIDCDSYIRPHRHALDPKAETLIAVRGLFALLVFDDSGHIQSLIRFGTEKYADALGVGVGVDLSPGIWHTIMALVPGSVLLELKAGPFNPAAAKEPAGWAPEEQTAEAMAYFESLKRKVKLELCPD